MNNAIGREFNSSKTTNASREYTPGLRRLSDAEAREAVRSVAREVPVFPTVQTVGTRKVVTLSQLMGKR